MEVFIAGIMQGSRDDDRIVDQNYRKILTDTLADHIPGAVITDPWTIDPESVSYGLEKARDAFLKNTAKAAEADVLIAYLPQASMGTAIEMWTAFSAEVPIVVVTPLSHNWVVWVTAHETYTDLESLLEYIRSGRFAERYLPG